MAVSNDQSSNSEKRSGRPRFSTKDVISGDNLSNLVHSLAHEIDNPLTAIISMATVITRLAPHEESEEFRKEKLPFYGQAISNEAWRVTRLVERLVLILSNRESGGSECDPLATLYGTLSNLRDQDEYDAVKIDITAPHRLPLVELDQHQLEILFRELLENAHEAASKLTNTDASRKAAVSINLKDSKGSLEMVIASKRVDPCPFELDQIFEPFITEYAVNNRLGLGLTVCSAIIERFGGEILVEEHQEGEGYSFVTTIRLPTQDSKIRADIIEKMEQPKTEKAATSGKKSVLIIDDEETVATAIKKLLELSYRDKGGLECAITLGHEGLERLRSDEHFDAVLCDLNLRDISGKQIYEEVLKSAPHRASHFAFITGDTRQGATKNYLDSTKRPVLHKPFEPEDLVELVEKLAK